MKIKTPYWPEAEIQIDDEDAHLLSDNIYYWRNGNPMRNVKKDGKIVSIYLVREIMKALPGQNVGIIKKYCADFRKSNLKIGFINREKKIKPEIKMKEFIERRDRRIAGSKI